MSVERGHSVRRWFNAGPANERAIALYRAGYGRRETLSFILSRSLGFLYRLWEWMRTAMLHSSVQMHADEGALQLRDAGY